MLRVLCNADKLQEANKKLKRHGQDELKLLRLYGKKHERMEFRGPHTSHGFLQLHEGEGRCEKRFQEDALHHIIRKECPELIEMEERFDKIHRNDKVPSPGLIKKYHKLIDNWEEKVVNDNHQIILCTCNETAGKRLKYLKKRSVAQVIVDECGMAHEPETMAAIGMSNHVVLIGDHKQLQPVIKYSAARESGLSTSLFQRYAEQFEEECPLITLEVQYRMVSNSTDKCACHGRQEYTISMRQNSFKYINILFYLILSL